MANDLPIDGNALAGSIPTEIAQCSQLIDLDLGFNKLTGSCDFVIVLINGKRVYHCVVGFAGAAEFKTTFMKTKVPKCSVFV